MTECQGDIEEETVSASYWGRLLGEAKTPKDKQALGDEHGTHPAPRGR